MYVYQRAPIDFWPGWLSERAFIQSLPDHFPTGSESVERSYLDWRDEAFAAAKSLGWEGDIREGPFVAGLPDPEGLSAANFMVAWKQDNNGTTFIASPFELSWMGADDRIKV